MTYILGVSAYYHDSAAALIRDGEIISAVQEERFSRKKHDSRFPVNSIKYLLNNSKIKLNDIKSNRSVEKKFNPSMPPENRKNWIKKWEKAIEALIAMYDQH